MFCEERYQYILNLLEKDGKVFVKELSNVFNMSESMVRKDLQALEQKQLLQRTYGGAISIHPTFAKLESLSKRVETNIEAKEIVAKKAANQIIDNDTIFLDASSTSYMIAKLLIQRDIHLTVITNMFEISTIIPEHTSIKFIFIGGDYHPIVGGSIGSYSIEQMKRYRCSKAFIGCCGVDLQDGCVSTIISEDACTKQAIMSISRELYLLILNEKFDQSGSFAFSNLTDFNGIMTEAPPNPSIKAILDQFGTILI